MIPGVCLSVTEIFAEISDNECITERHSCKYMYDQVSTITSKWCEIRCKLLVGTNVDSNRYFSQAYINYFLESYGGDVKSIA